MTGTAMSANMQQLMRANPHAGWDVVRALILRRFRSDHLGEERSLVCGLDSIGCTTREVGVRARCRALLPGAETSAAPDLAATASATDNWTTAAGACWLHPVGLGSKLGGLKAKDMIYLLYRTALNGWPWPQPWLPPAYRQSSLSCFPCSAGCTSLPGVALHSTHSDGFCPSLEGRRQQEWSPIAHGFLHV